MNVSSSVSDASAVLSPATSKPLTPLERERTKTAEQKGEDWSYTINHTLVCFATDSMQVPLAAGAALMAGTGPVTRFTKKVLGKAADVIGCGDAHYDPTQKFWPQYKAELKHWFKGEVIGDLGAVPITVGLQYFTPGLMHRINGLLEPLAGPFFRRGAERSTEKWARQHGVAKDSDEYRKHANEIYQHEVDHLAQAAVWTLTSVPINYLVQKYDRSHAGHNHGVGQFAIGKIAGAGITLGAVLGLRTQFPETVRSWDRWTNNYIFTPANQTVSRLFGVKATPSPAESAAPGTVVSDPRIAEPSQSVAPTAQMR
jgi:hypothetical protein